MVADQFDWMRTPRILFGPGSLAQLGETAGTFGRSAAVVTGTRSLHQSGRRDQAIHSLAAADIRCHVYEVGNEPTPHLVDELAADVRLHGINLVIAIGGGSVLDAGKAVAAMVPQTHPAEAFLEGVGTRAHDGRRIPLVAVPTTAGTGSEATANAVLSRMGPDGYKASLRHPNLVPDAALVDPELALSCPAHVTAACGMDALTQLIEAYVSVRASPMTDALARSGLIAVRNHLMRACRADATDVNARAGMAYASLASGLALANAGLGVVHGLAGVLGGLYPVPHGVACGTLVGVATGMNIAKLRETGGAALQKYAEVGRFLGAREADVDACCSALVTILNGWVDELSLPRLGEYGLPASGLAHVARRASNKNNPVRLSPAEMESLLSERL